MDFQEFAMSARILAIGYTPTDLVQQTAIANFSALRLRLRAYYAYKEYVTAHGLRAAKIGCTY
jgi:hypothetical protein